MAIGAPLQRRGVSPHRRQKSSMLQRNYAVHRPSHVQLAPESHPSTTAHKPAASYERTAFCVSTKTTHTLMTGHTEPPTTFAQILGEVPNLTDQARALSSNSWRSPFGSQSSAATISQPSGSPKEHQPRKLQKPRPTTKPGPAATDPWNGMTDTPGSHSLSPRYSSCGELEMQVSTGGRLRSTREDVAYDEKHFGNTYTAGWDRIRSTIRSTLSSGLGPICPGRTMKGYLDSALTATLGLPDITAAELNEAIQAERMHPNPEHTRTALARAARTPTVIDEYIARYSHYNLRYLEEVADRYPGKEGSAVRSRLRHNVATRMARDPDWTGSVSVFDTLSTWDNHWTTHGPRFTTPNPTTADYIQHLRGKADFLESKDRSEMVSQFMDPCDPAQLEATRAQARLEDTQEWESLTFLMGVPMRVLGLARSIPSMASSWLAERGE